MISWLWLIPVSILSATLGASTIAWLVASRHDREKREYDLVLDRIRAAQKPRVAK